LLHTQAYRQTASLLLTTQDAKQSLDVSALVQGASRSAITSGADAAAGGAPKQKRKAADQHVNGHDAVPSGKLSRAREHSSAVHMDSKPSKGNKRVNRDEAGASAGPTAAAEQFESAAPKAKKQKTKSAKANVAADGDAMDDS